MTFAKSVVFRSGGRPNPEIEQESNKVTKIWTVYQSQKRTKSSQQTRRTKASNAWPTTNILRRGSPRIFQPCPCQRMAQFVVFVARFSGAHKERSGKTASSNASPKTRNPRPSIATPFLSMLQGERAMGNDSGQNQRCQRTQRQSRFPQPGRRNLYNIFYLQHVNKKSKINLAPIRKPTAVGRNSESKRHWRTRAAGR